MAKHYSQLSSCNIDCILINNRVEKDNICNNRVDREFRGCNLNVCFWWVAKSYFIRTTDSMNIYLALIVCTKVVKDLLNLIYAYHIISFNMFLLAQYIFFEGMAIENTASAQRQCMLLGSCRENHGSSTFICSQLEICCHYQIGEEKEIPWRCFGT